MDAIKGETNKGMVFEIGPIRPPSEAGSLLLPVTRGCTWNKCKFCGVYRDTPFRAYSAEEVKRFIDLIAVYRERILALGTRDEKGALCGQVPNYSAAQQDMKTLSQEERKCYFMVYNWLAHGGDTVFLQDGNTVVLSSGRLADVLRYLKEKIPGIRRITSYGRAESLAKVALEQMRELKEAGLDRVHSGFESGSDAVLTKINKGVTAEEEILAGKKIKEAGIELSVYFMPGVGGRELSEDNAVETARVISAIDPDFVRLRTCVIKPGTALFQDVQEGRMIPCTDREKVLEIRELIQNITGCTGTMKSDHIINLLPAAEGSLAHDKEKMTAVIDDFLALPEEQQRRFQLARRVNLVETQEDMLLLDTEMDRKIDEICSRVKASRDWEALLNGYLHHYI